MGCSRWARQAKVVLTLSLFILDSVCIFYFPFGVFLCIGLECSWYIVQIRVFYTDRTDRIGVVRYRFTGPVRSETGRNRTNSNFKPKHAVQTVPTGIPTGSRSFNQKIELVENLTCFQIWMKNWRNKRKFSKNIARCIESNRVKTFQILVHLVSFCEVLEVQPANLFSFFFFSWTSNARKLY
jgi:hypothetical protein